MNVVAYRILNENREVLWGPRGLAEFRETWHALMIRDRALGCVPQRVILRVHEGDWHDFDPSGPGVHVEEF